MLNRMSMKHTILLPTIFIVILSTFSINILVFITTTKFAENLTGELLDETTNRYANLVRDVEETAYAIATTTLPVVLQARQLDNGREIVIDALQDIVRLNPSVLAVWTKWEPNQFDGLDARYINRIGHDSTGQFVPYVYRDNGAVLTEASSDYYINNDYLYANLINPEGVYYTEPYVHTTDSGTKMVYSISVPVKQSEKIIGVIGVDIDLDSFNDTMNQINFLEDGYVFVMNPNGYIMSHPNDQWRFKHYTETKYADYSSTIQEILALGGAAQDQDYSHTLNHKAYLQFQGIQSGGSDGFWIICAVVPTTVITATTGHMALLCILISCFAIFIIGISVYLIVNHSFRLLPQLTRKAEMIAAGDTGSLKQEFIKQEKTKNEALLLGQAFDHIVEATQKQVEAVQQIATGDLTVEIHPRSEKDILNQSLAKMVTTNNQVLQTILQSAGVVSAGANHISSSANILAQGAEEQNAAVEELYSNMCEMLAQAKENEEIIYQDVQYTNTVHEKAKQSTEKIIEMVAAVKDISSSSKDIYEILKILDNIAFQTNILSINAAIEAAHTNDGGKGFKVIANEIRNLSAKSAKAVQDTSIIIDTTIANTEASASIMLETHKYMEEIIHSITQSAENVGKISLVSQEQAKAIEKVNEVAQDLAEIVKQNTAAAEESAATSQELAGQVSVLKEQVLKFKL